MPTPGCDGMRCPVKRGGSERCDRMGRQALVEQFRIAACQGWREAVGDGSCRISWIEPRIDA
eukprot:2900065-Rhodomonas_salina.5